MHKQLIPITIISAALPFFATQLSAASTAVTTTTTQPVVTNPGSQTTITHSKGGVIAGGSSVAWTGAVASSSGGPLNVQIPTTLQVVKVKNPSSTTAENALATGKAIQFPSTQMPGKELKAFLVQIPNGKKGGAYALGITPAGISTDEPVAKQEFNAFVKDVQAAMQTTVQKKAKQKLTIHRDLHLAVISQADSEKAQQRLLAAKAVQPERTNIVITDANGQTAVVSFNLLTI